MLLKIPKIPKNKPLFKGDFVQEFSVTSKHF